LIDRKIDLVAGPPQQFDGSDANFGKELIDDAGDTERDAAGLFHAHYFSRAFVELLARRLAVEGAFASHSQSTL
jgi:hypothetical protein